VAPLAVLGLILCGRSPRAAPLALAACSGIAVAVLFFPSSRVRFPAVFALIPYAAAGIVEALRLARRQAYARLAVAVVGALVTAVLVAAPWYPSSSDLRYVDFAVGNEIALFRVRSAEGDPALQRRLLAAQLRSEPGDLRRADPAAGRSVLSERSAKAAPGFSSLHAAAARVYAYAGDRQAAELHLRRAEILAAIGRQAEAAGR
jgi:hypothetical protein